MNPGLLNILNLSNTKVGHTLVSPGFHAEPSFLSDEARDSASLFSSRMLNHQYHPDLTALDSADEGATDKIHFRVGGHRDANGKLQPSSIYMVKPYYENLSSYQYGHYPLSGWAEMAYHGLLNAAGLGHLGMRLHAFPYHDSALLGVELEQGLVPVWNAAIPAAWSPQTKAGRMEFLSGTKDDAAKIGALDFLTNNQDRNSGNLMISPDENGVVQSILPIDNGRSMQYMESHHVNARYANRDNLLDYLSTFGLSPVLGEQVNGPLKAIAGWWPQVKPRVVGEFHKHLQGIKHVELASHMANSFKDRVQALDNAVEDFTVYGSNPYQSHSSNPKNGFAASILHRAGVQVRSWKPQEDPQPLQMRAEKMDSRLHPLSCPTCGEDYQST